MSRNRQSKPDISKSEQRVLNWSFDEEFQLLATMGLVYDPGTNSIHRQGAFGNVGCVKFDPSDEQPNYIGINTNADATTGDTDWNIYKFTYSGTSATEIKRKTGAWDGRAALFL